MREIKFRAIEKGDDKFVYYHNWESIRDLARRAEYGYIDVICQYSGLKDKNGTEIFEGDIVNDKELGKGIVVFQSGCFFMMYDADTNMEFLGIKTDIFGRLQEKRIVEIIGNIYESPELLENEKSNS